MAKYEVLRTIEFGGKLYTPKKSQGPKQMPSGSDGSLIDVDRSGVIELPDEVAAAIVQGQIPLFQGKPDPIGAPAARARLAKKKADDDDAALKANQDEYQRYQKFEARNAKK